MLQTAAVLLSGVLSDRTPLTTHALLWDLNATFSARDPTYEESALIITNGRTLDHQYALQGLLNSAAGAGTEGSPLLFLDTGRFNFDFPGSDSAWVDHLTSSRGVVFGPPPPPSICGLVSAAKSRINGIVAYPSDGFSVFPALTISGLDTLLPISSECVALHPCLAAPSLGLQVKVDLGAYNFTDKLAAHRWAITHLLPRCNTAIVFNADKYPDAVQSQGAGTIMSVDYPVGQKGFIMDLCPLYVCDPIDCGAGGGRKAAPLESALFTEVVSKSAPLVSVWGWSDPEHAGTNVTTHAGGVVFCTFSTPNLSFWSALGKRLGTIPLPLPVHDGGHKLDLDGVYLAFETNEGDTPRILTSQFTSAWLSPHRGSVPISWAVDSFLGELFPEIWNFYAGNTTANDTFVSGVDGAGYIFLDSLSPAEARVYESRAGRALRRSGPDPVVVDVGVADHRWPAVTPEELAVYVRNSKAGTGFTGPGLLLNACGHAYGQKLNFYLPDGTPVVNSVCHGPPQNDTSNGHYLYYYRSGLNATDPAADFASRIRWAANEFKEEGRPLFLLLFGGLGLYGGNEDIFLFLNRTLKLLAADGDVPVTPVGAQEFARLAIEAVPARV